MRPGHIPRDRTVVTGLIAAAIAALAAPNAFSADRVVLGEFFTWVNCPSCEIAEPRVEIWW